MQQALTISDQLYQRLQVTARENGLSSIEQLLEYWQKRESTLKRRREIVRNIVAIREQLVHEHVEFPDSVALVQEDRAR
ncbi:MAG: hypothetical protein U0350_06470 [Caldilineaceae bacterium]